MINAVILGKKYTIRSPYGEFWTEILNGKTCTPLEYIRIEQDELGAHTVYRCEISPVLSEEEIQSMTNNGYVDPTQNGFEIWSSEMEDPEPLPTFLEVQNFGGEYGSVGVLNNDGKFLMQLEIFKDDEEPEYIQTPVSEEFFRAFVKEFKK